MKKLVWLVGVFLVIYLASLTFRSYSFYSFVKLNWYGWSTGMFEKDESLGFKLQANNSGYQIFPQNRQISVFTGPKGNRVDSMSFNNKENSNSGLLFIGDSHVFGDGCIAEQTFPFLTSKKLNQPYINLGVSSFGISQMQTTLNNYLKTNTPDKVFIQYSPWLAERSANWFVPVYIGVIPVPYYYQKNDSFLIHPAPFYSKLVGTDVFKYRHTEKSVGEFLGFLFKNGLMVYLHTDLNLLLTKLKFLFGLLPKPITNLEEIETFAYNQMIQDCKQNGVEPYFLFLTIDWENDFTDLKTALNQKAAIIDMDAFLRSKLEENTEENYFKEYGHWIGEYKDFLADEHPNPKAHQLISDIIVSSITPDTLSTQIPLSRH